MSIVKIPEIYISNLESSDIDDVVKIEAEAYGEHHWSKSSFYDEINSYCKKIDI